MFQPSNKLRNIRRVLYSLKKGFGVPMDIYQITKSDLDPRTGRQIIERRRIQIRKAILLPTVLARKFSYDLSYIAANKNFTYGGQYDIRDRMIIVEASDMPDGLAVKTEDYLVMEGSRYEVKSVEDLEFKYGFIITARETPGAPVNQVIHLKLNNVLNLGQITSWR